MGTVASRDGTAIAYEKTGAGTPLVLVHGTGASSARWAPILPALAQAYSVYAIDRRGRGASDDAETYALEREFEDVAVLTSSIGEPVALLGHSYGGICALEAALLTRQIRALILYEPPLPLGGVPIYPDGLIERLEVLLESGDRAGVVTTFFREVVRMPPHELERFQTLPAWPTRVAAAHTLPRELRAHTRYHFAPERFAALHIPTLLLVGGDSPPFFKAAIATLGATLPQSRTVSLPDQQHIAIDTAPELFVQEVRAFLDALG
jgi:pimeloyl-ACP methyl ester carboxylesterase